MHLTLILSVLLTLGWVAEASAMEVVAPRDGDSVAAKPTFMFDFTEGSADVQVATNPELLTAGDRAGYFVDPVDGDFFLLPYDAPGGVATFAFKLNAGRYFWHAKLDDYYVATPPVWTPLRTFTVRDEPIVVEGWLLRSKRLRLLSRMDFNRQARSQPERTRREDRRLRFYGLRDNLNGPAFSP